MILDLFMFVQQIWALLKYLRFARFDYTDLCCIQIYFNSRLLRASMATKTIPAHTAAHIQTCCIYVFKSNDGGFAFNFISLHLRYERTYIRLHVVSCKMRKVFFYLFVVESFFCDEAFLRRKFVRSTLNFPCQMKGGNHLTLLTSKNLHSHVNLTQNLFIFPPRIFYYCAGWLASFFLYQSTQRKETNSKDNGFLVK